MAKRSFDFVCALILLIVLLPFLLVVAFAVRLSSPGPAFYRGVRVGCKGKLFRMWKFRTMVANAEQLGGACTSSDDPRITSLGRWLRRYKLDEFPQLLNVLLGEMSLVGPRPEVQEYVDLFTEEERAILSVKPGITDWATIWGCNEEQLLAGCPNPDREYLEWIRPEKIRRQLGYVNEHTFFVDLKILFATSGVMLGRFLGVAKPKNGRVQQTLGKQL
jgi:lipopolysaccharide/colanic/teichoic acid biosynthesis glycosyltransferase